MAAIMTAMTSIKMITTMAREAIMTKSTILDMLDMEVRVAATDQKRIPKLSVILP